MIDLDNAKLTHTKLCLLNHNDEQKASNAVAVLHIKGAQFDALISLQGAQLLAFTPKGGKPWLYYPENIALISGLPIDAGIPLCLPWFGRHKKADYPIHGYLRNQPWTLSALYEEQEDVVVEFSYQHKPTPMFAHAFCAKHRLRLSDSINLNIEVQNLSPNAMPLSFAWHSYFATSNSYNTKLTGLEQHLFLDNLHGLRQTVQNGAINFGPAIDAVFESASFKQILISPEQTLSISGEHCPTSIIWNPGNAKDFICAERGSAFADSVTLAPTQTYQASLSIKELI